jgi:hypothetical protein
LKPALEQGRPAAVLETIRNHRAVLEDAMSKEKTAVSATLAIATPAGLSDTESSLLATARQNSAESHRQEAEAYQKLLTANSSNLVEMVQGFFEHARLAEEASSRAGEAVKKAQQ